MYYNKRCFRYIEQVKNVGQIKRESKKKILRKMTNTTYLDPIVGITTKAIIRKNTMP